MTNLKGSTSIVSNNANLPVKRGSVSITNPKGDTSIFSNDVAYLPVKRRSVSVIKPQTGLSTLPVFNSIANNPKIKVSTETKSSADSASNSQEDTANKSSITSTNKLWVNIFIESSLDIIVLVYVDNGIILSRDKRLIASFIDILTHGPERFAFTD